MTQVDTRGMTTKQDDKVITEDDVEYGEQIHEGPQTPGGKSL